jgi:hypothetical protein
MNICRAQVVILRCEAKCTLLPCLIVKLYSIAIYPVTVYRVNFGADGVHLSSVVSSGHRLLEALVMIGIALFLFLVIRHGQTLVPA